MNDIAICLNSLRLSEWMEDNGWEVRDAMNILIFNLVNNSMSLGLTEEMLSQGVSIMWIEVNGILRRGTGLENSTNREM